MKKSRPQGLGQETCGGLRQKASAASSNSGYHKVARERFNGALLRDLCHSCFFLSPPAFPSPQLKSRGQLEGILPHSDFTQKVLFPSEVTLTPLLPPPPRCERTRFSGNYRFTCGSARLRFATCNLRDNWRSDPKPHRLRYLRRFNAVGTLGQQHPRAPRWVLCKCLREQRALSCCPQPVPHGTLILQTAMERGNSTLAF